MAKSAPDPTVTSLQQVRAIHQLRAREQRLAQPFLLSWRGGGESEQIIGWPAAAARLGISLPSLRVYISKGRGSHSCELPNPLTGEPDLATLAKLILAKPKRPRGRPAKPSLNDDRLGTEAP